MLVECSIYNPPTLIVPSASVLRVAYATASTLQFVSGMSYMAALMLVQEPMESMAYATLVTVLQVSGTLYECLYGS